MVAPMLALPAATPASVGAPSVPAFLPAVAAASLAAVHLFAGRLRLLDAVPRSRWLSFSGGSAVAYVFVHVLPEIHHARAAIEASDSALVYFERHVYLIALLGFTVFYGLERYVRRSTERGAETTEKGVFRLHVASFAAYNALVGYLLLHREEPGIASLLAFSVAMAFHLLVNDFGLREHHGEAYHRYGRWVLAVAVVVGLAVGYLVPVSELFLAVLFAFLAGGVILNVIKEELPAERKSRFPAFAAGVLGYTAVPLV